jgi:serine/threonine protein kinase
MIGKGSFAQVYLVESKSNNDRFAVKAFSKSDLTKENKSNAKTVLINEIDLLRAVSHDNIIKLFEVHESENSIYLVMELIQGNSLQDILKKSSLRKGYTDIQLKGMIRSMLDALAHVASQGIMHRDIKPGNILIEKDGTVKIVDFGLSTYVNVPKYIFKKCGTPGYIAPEVFKYKSKVPTTSYNDRCDVFSVGCILFNMLFGYPFFDGSNASLTLQLNRTYNGECEALNMIKKELENPSEKTNKEALRLLLALLEFDHQKRISSADALYHSYLVEGQNGPFQTSNSQEFRSNPSQKSNQTDETCQTERVNTDESLRDEPSPKLLPENRFSKKDSLYLDVGRPDMNGKLDTITTMYVNNSLSVKGSCASPTSTSNSTFEQRTKTQSKTVKPSRPANNQSFLKAAIFRNMQKNSELDNDEGKEPEVNGLIIQRQNSAGIHNKFRDLDEF